jgi:hypothetical protein
VKPAQQFEYLRDRIGLYALLVASTIAMLAASGSLVLMLLVWEAMK